MAGSGRRRSRPARSGAVPEGGRAWRGRRQNADFASMWTRACRLSCPICFFFLIFKTGVRLTFLVVLENGTRGDEFFFDYLSILPRKIKD
jgi:hypothetical protein